MDSARGRGRTVGTCSSSRWVRGLVGEGDMPKPYIVRQKNCEQVNVELPNSGMS